MSDDTAEALFGNAMAMAQGAAAMTQLAAMLGSFCKALAAQGFSEEQALALCETWLQVFGSHRYDGAQNAQDAL